MVKVSEVLMRYKVDKASVNDVLSAQNKMISGQEQLAQSAAGGAPLPFDIVPDDVAEKDGVTSRARRVSAFAGQQVSMLGGMGGIGGQAGQALSSLGNSIGALGPIGIATTAATVALGFALVETRKQMEEAKKATEAVIDVIKDRSVLETKTTEELRSIQAEREKELQIQTSYRDDLSQLNQLMKEADAGMQGFDGVIYDLKQSLYLAGAEQATVESAYKAANVEVDKATGLLENVAGAFDSVGNAAADAAAAMRQDATAAGDRVRFETEAAKRGVEASQERIDAIGAEEVALQAELDVLKQSGDTSAETTKRISELEKQLAKLGMESGVVSNAISSGAAASVDAAKEAADAEKKAASERERAQAQVETSNQRYADSIRNIGRQTREAIADAKRSNRDRMKDLAQGLADTFADAAVATQQERADILTDQQDAEQAALRNNTREMENIHKEAARSERDAIRNRDFLSLARIAEDTKARIGDAKEQFSQEAIERNIANQLAARDFQMAKGRERQETLRNYDRQRRDLATDMNRQLRDIKTGRDRQLRLAREAHNRELQMAQQAMQQLLTLDQQFWQRRINMANQAVGGGNNAAAQALQALNQIGITA